MYCSKCRKQINTEDKFCNNCSNQIESTIVNQYEQNANKNSDNQNPDKNYINNDSKKKGKTAAIIIGLILLVIRFGGKFVINKEEFSDFNDKITIAIEKVNEKYPDFIANPNEVYVNAHRYEDKWYAYVFTEKDKGLGAEVYYENGTYTINFDYQLYEYRIRLIAKMNELMPEIKELNKHVSWVPRGIDYKSIYEGTSHNEISYVVIRNNIDIDRQLAIDYEIMKYSYELSKELGIELNGFWVAYYEGNSNDIKVTNKNALFTRVDRDFGVSSFEVYMIKDFVLCKKEEYCFTDEEKPEKIKKINEYIMVFEGASTNMQTKDIESVLKSKDNFINYANSIRK